MFKVYFYYFLYYNRSIALQQRLIYLCRLFEISENFKIVIMRDRRGEEYVNVVIYYLFFCGFFYYIFSLFSLLKAKKNKHNINIKK